MILARGAERLEQPGLLTRRGLIARDQRGDAYRLTLPGERLMPLLHGLEVWARMADDEEAG